MSKVSHRGCGDARKELPSLIKAAEGGRATIITRRGRPVAALVPLAAFRDHHRQRWLLPLEGSGAGRWRRHSGRALSKLRGEWNR